MLAVCKNTHFPQYRQSVPSRNGRNSQNATCPPCPQLSTPGGIVHAPWTWTRVFLRINSLSRFCFATNLAYICGKTCVMADQSTYNSIKRRVEEAGRGALFFPDTFADAGTSDAVRSALVRLCENGVLTRVAQGIYCYPRVDERWGGGSILPSVEEIAQAIAARDRVRIAPTGAYALYRLGLSTQIPANVVFVTDGSPGGSPSAKAAASSSNTPRRCAPSPTSLL